MSSYLSLWDMGKEYLHDRFNRVVRDPEDRSGEENMEGKIVIVTGCNTGIGKTTVIALAKRNARVIIMACRNLDKAQQAKEDILNVVPLAHLVVMELDLSSLASVRKFCQMVKEKYDHIDILINNGGFIDTNGVLQKTVDGFESHLGTNYLGHFLLTLLLLDIIKKGKSSRIVCVSSALHMRAQINLDDLMLESVTSYGYNNWLPYANSKLALMLFMKELARRLKAEGANNVHTYSVCPGLVATEAFRYEPWHHRIMSWFNLKIVGISADEGCQTSVMCAVSTTWAQDSGKMYRFCAPWERATNAMDGDLAVKLWEKSEELVGSKTI